MDKHIDAFVRELRHKGALAAPWLEDAVRGVPRHHFIEQYYDNKGDLGRFDPDHPLEEQLKLIYSDTVLTIRKSPHSSASQPSIVTGMLADLDVQSDHKVFEMGTGSGWNAGLLSYRTGAANVYSMDAQQDLVERAAVHLRNAGIDGVNLRTGDAGHGWPETAPFDRIVATVGCPDIAPAWQEQLAEEGVLLAPLKTSGISDPLIRLRKQHGRMVGGFRRWSWWGTLQGDYWTDTEDLLIGLEPWVDELLGQDPRVTALPEVMTIDCLFFLRLRGLQFQALHDPRSPGVPTGGYLHRESRSVFSPSTELPPVLRVYGDSDLGKLVSGYQQEWIQLGRPKITDYQAELVGRDAVCGSSRSWLDRRQHACLRFSLG